MLLKDELDIIGVKEVSGCGKSLAIDSNSGLYEGVLIKESIVDENILDLLEIKKGGDMEDLGIPNIGQCDFFVNY